MAVWPGIKLHSSGFLYYTHTQNGENNCLGFCCFYVWGKRQIHKNLLLKFYLMPLWLSEIFICNLFATRLKRQDQIYKQMFLKKKRKQELISRIGSFYYNLTPGICSWQSFPRFLVNISTCSVSSLSCSKHTKEQRSSALYSRDRNEVLQLHL